MPFKPVKSWAMLTFESLENELNSYSIELHAAQLHGILVGHACGLKKDAQGNNHIALYEKWLGLEPPLKIKAMLDSAYSETIEDLGEFSDFEFRLLLPLEEKPINERVVAISLWCGGFLSGFGEAGGSYETKEADVIEALADLKTISEMEVYVPDGEESEVDLAEIEEFVRVIVLMIFAETNTSSPY